MDLRDPIEFKLRLIIGLAGALGGLLGGAFAGILVLILIIIVTGSTFGLHNIYYPGALMGAGVGAILGFCFPKIGRNLFYLLSDFSG